jgi:hypothetical protein
LTTRLQTENGGKNTPVSRLSKSLLEQDVVVSTKSFSPAEWAAETGRLLAGKPPV